MARQSYNHLRSNKHIVHYNIGRLCDYFSLFWCTLLLLAASSSHAHTSTQPTSLGVHIVRAPESAVAPKGDEVVFECELNLAPDRLDWRFRHTTSSSIDANNFHYLRSQDGHNITTEERTSKLRIFVSTETLGDYQCVAWYGSAGIASTAARLTLVSISIDNSNGYTRNAIRWSVAPKNCILIRCGTVTSNPPAIWSFYRNGEKIPQTAVLAANGALILNSVSAKDSGNYTCAAMNAITGVELKLPQRIDVRVDYSERTPPYFLLQPQSQVIARPGETVVLECPGVGSPPPEAVWSSPNINNISNNRTKMLSYGLQISDVLPEDQGSYVCRLDNGIAPALVHIIKFIVQERPQILRGPATTVTDEGDSLELECSAAGNPFPYIYWLINGEDTSNDNETFHEDRRLVIKHVQKRHAGIVQCFAKNEVGEISEASLLQVIPKQITGEVGSTPLGNVPIRPTFEHSGNKNKSKKKHMKMANMIPPSRPNVTRLSDNAVMLRWNVPRNNGLPIQFFKVQYRMMGDKNRKIPRENWQTTNEDIPYGKRDRNYEGDVKNFTSSVNGLKPDRIYRFRIIAVYSNNDNKEGASSERFFLQRAESLGPQRANLPAPELVRIESLSETAVVLHWSLPPSSSNMVDGFYAYYRPASSAGEYLKATVDGMHTRRFKIDMLESGTAYEFKLQSFNALAASEFSAILQGRTKKIPTVAPPTVPAAVPKSKANEEDNSIYPVIAGAAGGGFLLLIATIAACLCIRRRQSSQPEDEDKPQLDHIQADFVTPAVLGVSSHHKTSGHRLNGVMPRMNITPNPLAQEGDKNRNVMELRFMTNTNNTNTNSGPPVSPNSPSSQKFGNSISNHDNTDEIDGGDSPQPRRSSSSCETLEATDGVATSLSGGSPNNGQALTMDPSSPLSKPLPPLPSKANAIAKTANHTTTPTKKNVSNVTNSNSLTANKKNHHQHSQLQLQSQSQPQQQQHHNQNNHQHHQQLQPQQQQHANHHQYQNHNSNYHNNNSNTPTTYNNLHNNNLQNHQQQQQQQQFISTHQQHSTGLHHAQPYHHQPHQHQTPPPGTPTFMHKRNDYHQQPPPVPPHQNNNHHQQNQLPYQNHRQQSSPPPLTPSMDQHRRTLDRSARNLHYPTTTSPPPHDSHQQLHEGLPATRIPSLRRTRRTSGNANNNNGGVGIPIVVPGSPRVQRSPMPARAMIKRSRLGSHNDNISSGSLNSIEV